MQKNHCLITLLVLLLLANAAPARAELPPRTPETSQPARERTRSPHATICLQASVPHVPGENGVWTVVQWQDTSPAAAWHDVDGWRGQMAGGSVCWSVAYKDFGSGPFRWAVLAPATAGAPLSVSRPFTLPAQAGEVLSVTVE